MRIAIARETSETKTKILPNIEQLEKKKKRQLIFSNDLMIILQKDSILN